MYKLQHNDYKSWGPCNYVTRPNYRTEDDDLNIIQREKRLRWFRHIKQSSGAIKTVCDMQIEGKRGPGRPKMTWRTITERDRCEWKLNEVDPPDRDVCRSNVRSAMHAASKLPGGEPTDVEDATAPAQ